MRLKKSDLHALRAKWRLLRAIEKNMVHSGFVFDYQIIKKLTRFIIDERAKYELSSDL